MSGYRDAIENASKNYKRHKDYVAADRLYNADFGTKEDYRDGYQQGFEAGYDAGFDKRSFDAVIPVELKKRGVINAEAVMPEKNVAEKPAPSKQPPTAVVKTSAAKNDAQTDKSAASVTDAVDKSIDPAATDAPVAMTTRTSYDDAIIVIPKDTELVIELLDEITTEHTEEGEQFRARVVSPYEISGAMIEGRVSKIQKPGKLKRRAEILLSFDRIVLNDDRWSNYNAILTEVLPVKGDNIRRVDTEGTVEGKSSLKNDIAKVGAATGTGTVIGAIAGGPVGAAVGAGVGGAFGVGAVVIERGKHIRIQKNQQLRIKTSYETQIR